MHRALDIAEIVQMICREFAGGSGYHSKSLSSLARTSRFFHEPAVEVLWHTQLTFNHVLTCLPTDSWEQSPDSTIVRQNLASLAVF